MKLLFENWRGYLNEKEQEVREGCMKILFLHGLESEPGGAKAKYLEDLGHTVLNPSLPKEDFERSVEIAQAEVDNEQPDIVVGSSRGGAVGLSLDLHGAKLVLIAPAWQKYEASPQTPPGTTVLHCASDEQVAYEDSEKLEGEPRLVPCGEGHRMNDPEALAALKDAIKLAGGRVDCVADGGETDEAPV